jgi:hypothetical protein
VVGFQAIVRERACVQRIQGELLLPFELISSNDELANIISDTSCARVSGPVERNVASYPELYQDIIYISK